MKNKKTNTLQILINVLIWLFIFVLPFLMLWRHDDIDLIRLGHNHAITVLSSALVFYLEYFVLTEKFLFQKKIWKFLGSNLLLILVVGLIVYFLKDFRMEKAMDNMHPSNYQFKAYLFYIREVFSMGIVAGISIITKVLGKWYVTEGQRQEEEKRRKEAELINLRQQINPHFFFNTLNNIYALIAISPEKAQDTVLELSKLMRYVLYDNTNNFVALHKELDFIKNYIELMRIRLTDNVDLKVDIQADLTSNKLIAPMIFISLIENAFKHGVSHSQPSFIHVNIHQVEDRIVCLIKNSYFPKDESDKSGSGIGLENLHRRLDILYPHKHILRCDEKNNTYVCELIVPLK
ncbi:sensor histidine kinase [Paludibacter sp. 221]|uniref:sensor histidine kinase n=1 Tax=Paludibacter sp. 221 TaxID=2302939 RepID=UPI0013D8ACCC|nr:histidine kinase [Paludibacter sp. 221]NDV46652.1 sensor histidine kinase [Paludibacter sp. 221]